MVKIACLCLLSVLFCECISISLPSATDSFSVVAFFIEEETESELAFKYGLQWHNIYSTEDTIFHSEIKQVPERNIFTTSKIVCNITNASPGITAVFGPDAVRIAPITKSICKKLEIPHIQTTWESYSTYPPVISLNFFPSAKVLAQGFAVIAKHLDWKRYAIVYQYDKSLIRLEEILKIPDVHEKSVMVRQLLPNADYRLVFKELKVAGITKIILDCDTDQTIDILLQAKEVGLLNVATSYLLISLDSHTLDFDLLDDTPANITMVRLFEPENNDLIKHIENWKVGEMRNNRFINITQHTVRSEAVVMIDAVNLFVEAVNHLHKTQKIKPKSMDCSDNETWDDGYRIASYMKEHHLKDPITGPIYFNDFGERLNFTLQIFELNDDKVKATWCPSNGTYLNFTTIGLQRRLLSMKRLQRDRVIVSSKLLSPYLMHRKKSKFNDAYKNQYEGYVVDLIDKIANELNFTYKFHLTEYGGNGNYDPVSKKWNGIMGDILSGTAQLGVCDLTVTHQRRQYVDFSNYFMTLGISILYKKPKINVANIYAFMDPLHQDVWIYTLTVGLLIAVIIHLIAKMAPGDWVGARPWIDDPEELVNEWSLENSVYMVAAMFLKGAVMFFPKGLSTRMALSMWWFFCLIITSSYTANLAAFLSKERMTIQIRDFDDLISQNKIKFGTLMNGTTYDFFRLSNYSKHKEAWKKMVYFQPTVFVDSNSEGVRRVLNKNKDYAFFMESSSLEYEINKDCDLIEVGDWLDSKGYGIAMPLDAPYRAEINNVILKLQEAGELEELRRKWWKDLNKNITCEQIEMDPSDIGKMNIENVGGIFVVLAVGTVISYVIAYMEFLWNVRNVALYDNVSYWKAFKSEVRFATKIWIIRKPARLEHSREPSVDNTELKDLSNRKN